MREPDSDRRNRRGCQLLLVLIFLAVAALIFVGLNTSEKNNVEEDISVLVSN